MLESYLNRTDELPSYSFPFSFFSLFSPSSFLQASISKITPEPASPREKSTRDLFFLPPIFFFFSLFLFSFFGKPLLALLFLASAAWPSNHQHGPCHLDLLHIPSLVAAFMPKGRSPLLTKSHSGIILEMPPCFNL